jgi:LPS-assembly protein
MPRWCRSLFVLWLLAACSETASAQVSIGGYTIHADRQERLGESHWILTGRVELEGENTRLYADEVEYFVDEHRAVCRGNVTLVQGDSRISADRAEFNTETRLGRFERATGSTRVTPPRATSGALAPPPLVGQENDVYFFGDVIEKIGPKKYRISNGGFTTCVQPTPRWNLTASTVVLNVDDYTLLQQAVLKVKGVPLLYVPFLYYPTTEEDRATGILIPTYGASTLRGQNLSNAFFWAIGRSHDATFEHDWFSRGAQALGGEYRYNIGSGDGNIRAYSLDQEATTYLLDNGSTSTLAESRSYDIRGAATQRLPGGFRAQARVNYFSSFETSQTFNTDVYDASRNQRTIGANVVGAFSGYTLNGTFVRNEYFYDAGNSGLTGSSPRVTLNRNERPLFGNSPIYFSIGSEIARMDQERRTSNVVVDNGLTRFDINPQIRYPFKRWQWFTVNTTMAWRDTFYSRSLLPGTSLTVADDVNRQFFTVRAQAVGPVFTRVWNTPSSGYAERFKHSIEPFVNMQRTSAIDEFDRIVQIDGIDRIVGKTTSVTYGLTNRLYARRRVGQTSLAQEIASVEISQSYYTDARSAIYDAQYATNPFGAAPSHFSPISVGVRANPSPNVNATARAEIDSEYYELRTLSVNGAYNWANRMQTSVGWSQRYYIEELPGFNNPDALDHYLNVGTNLRTVDNRFGGAYMINYDILRSSLMQQRMTAFYNAQCCGIAFEYQTFNFGAAYSLPGDSRFFLSFTLAGLGNFSPFSGAMSGVPR